ncbi:glycoside hydrolase family 32 protein [Sunxiuqinia sp. A32]|uniref:glycoside hydrolase family 32 protein n=1 Tax=Sunxiuqinia sp. A32 TaxID=3461496 RepID=UPI0040451CDE
MQSSVKSLILFGIILLLIAAKPEKKPFNEDYRPQFHFTPEKNWHNDPNGLIYYDGEYHLFYQHNPIGNEWGYMHWGHAISKDLVHWEHFPIALYPDENSTDEKFCTEFSGCAIVDENNILGFQEGAIKTLVAIYTSYQCGQRIAYSTDKGRTWEKLDKNPVIPFDEKDDARDPKVFWYEPTQNYVMALYRMPDGEDAFKGISFYTSENLIDWTYQSHVPGYFECPDLIELPVNRRPDDKRWVLIDGDGSYMIGQFDGKEFTPESSKMRGDYGKNYYATQTWNNIPEEDGRTIQIAWMRGCEFPGMPFNGQMNFPCELSLRKYKEGIRLVRNPIKEIELLHEKGEHFKEKNLIPGLENKNLLRGIKGDCLHFIGTFDLKTVNSFGIMVRHSKKSTGTEIRYDATKNALSCLGQVAPLQPEDGKIKLEILLDRTSIEIFGNDGKVVMTSGFTAEPDMQNVVLYNTGGELYIEQLEVYPMKSIYE